MLRNLYNQLLKKRFFNRVLLTYVTIIIIVMLVLSFIITASISNILQSNESEYIKLVLFNLDSYLDEKYENAINITKRLYIDNNALPEVLGFFEGNYDKSSNEYIRTKRIFDNYIDSFFSRDRDITDVIVFKKKDDSIYHFSRDYIREYEATNFIYSERLEQVQKYQPLSKVYPAFQPKYSANNNMVYTYSQVVKSTSNIEQTTGLLMFDFDSNGITYALSSYTKSLKGDVLVMTKQGDIIYDSSGRYYGGKYPYFNQVLETNQYTKIVGVNYLVNTVSSNRLNLLVVSIIPQKIVLKSVDDIKIKIYTTALLCILLSILVTITSTSFYSRRINIIIGFMKKVREGNLAQRIKVRTSEDELGEISISFNKMCENLQDYIDKVYISDIKQKGAELKQKSAELTALQAQINPHFLYNTLEAIRMKAVSCGENEVGNMIYILSKLFRNMVKEDQIVEVGEEISYAKMYLDLFKIRYGDRLHVKFDVNADNKKYGIIKHILQPIIENYILYGFNSNNLNNTIEIKSYQEGMFLFITVSDNGKGISTDRLKTIRGALEAFDLGKNSSIGLANINERIRIIYGNTCGVDIVSMESQGTCVTVKVLAITKKELIDHVQSVTG